MVWSCLGYQMRCGEEMNASSEQLFNAGESGTETRRCDVICRLVPVGEWPMRQPHTSTLSCSHSPHAIASVRAKPGLPTPKLLSLHTQPLSSHLFPDQFCAVWLPPAVGPICPRTPPQLTFADHALKHARFQATLFLLAQSGISSCRAFLGHHASC